MPHTCPYRCSLPHRHSFQAALSYGSPGPLQLQACILGGDDMAASLGATRSADNAELAHARGQFLLTCRAMQVQAIDIVKVRGVCVMVCTVCMCEMMKGAPAPTPVFLRTDIACVCVHAYRHVLVCLSACVHVRMCSSKCEQLELVVSFMCMCVRAGVSTSDAVRMCQLMCLKMCVCTHWDAGARIQSVCACE